MLPLLIVAAAGAARVYVRYKELSKHERDKERAVQEAVANERKRWQ